MLAKEPAAGASVVQRSLPPVLAKEPAAGSIGLSARSLAGSLRRKRAAAAGAKEQLPPAQKSSCSQTSRPHKDPSASGRRLAGPRAALE